MAVERVTTPPSRLLGVIETQTEIARLGVDLGGMMALITERAQVLTHAVGAVVELAEGDDMVYRAASGIVEPHLGLHPKRGDNLSGLCIEQRQPLRCDDSETAPPRRPRRLPAHRPALDDRGAAAPSR